MEKVMIGKTSIIRASTIVIAGVIVNGKPNYLTLGAYGGMSIDPPILYISVNKVHYSNTGIKENGYFSVNLPSKNLLEKTDYVGIVSGRDHDKSQIFKAFYSSVNEVPMIEECPVNHLCRLINTVDLPKNEVFIGEIVETYVSKEYLADNKPDLEKFNPLLLVLGNYCELGKPIGPIRTAGKALLKN